MSVEILYTSESILAAVRKVLGKGGGRSRRVVLVAYLGEDAAFYLTNPEGLHVICDPKPGSTCPDAVRALITQGAKVQFSPRLHMKVYWSARGGCVIGSVNTSSSAFGAGGLREAGVLLGTGEVDIDRLIEISAPEDVSSETMDILDKGWNQPGRVGTIGPTTSKTPSYLEWFHSPYRRKWKLSWWTEDDSIEFSESAKAKSMKKFGTDDLHFMMNNRKGEVAKEDWLLTYKVGPRGANTPEWMYVDFVVPVDPKDTKSYDKDFPFQAIQVKPLSKYPIRPPFDLKTKGFAKAFSAAMRGCGLDRELKVGSYVPHDELIEAIAVPLERLST